MIISHSSWPTVIKRSWLRTWVRTWSRSRSWPVWLRSSRWHPRYSATTYHPLLCSGMGVDTYPRPPGTPPWHPLTTGRRCVHSWPRSRCSLCPWVSTSFKHLDSHPARVTRGSLVSRAATGRTWTTSGTCASPRRLSRADWLRNQCPVSSTAVFRQFSNWKCNVRLWLAGKESTPYRPNWGQTKCSGIHRLFCFLILLSYFYPFLSCRVF